MNDSIAQQIERLYRESSRQVFASLARLLRDLDLADDAMQEAFTAATIQWTEHGMPDHPVAWLIATGKFKAVDLIRRREKLRQVSGDVARRLSLIAHTNQERSGLEIEDDRLRLIFTCCHPAIDRSVQVPLTLREVCGLTTEEIARAFLTTPATMAQRIVRGKNKIRDAAIPFTIPGVADLPERIESVLSVIYLIFNEGYSASTGCSLTRPDLSGESIRLCRLLLRLTNDAEVMGLLALMLLHESRRESRQSRDGDIILLEDQDRSRWDRELIAEGETLVRTSLATRRFGVFTIQAAISAVHASAKTATETDWDQIVSLYDVLSGIDPSPVIELNRAVAVAMRDGPAAGVRIIDSILDRGELLNYALAHSARGELLRRCGRATEAIASLKTSISLTLHQTEKRFLQRKIDLILAE